MGWSKNVDLPRFDHESHEILYYVGCTPSYDTRAQNIALALLRLFNAANVAFGVLGESEPCSGEEILSVGHKPYFREIAETTGRVFKESDVSKIVTSDPHSYDAFRNHYPSLEQDQISPFHYTQFLNHLLESNRLKFRKAFDRKVTFHDPCYLARHNNEIDSPRRVLSAIPGLEFVEMQNIGIDTLCCGGGGGRMWLETEAGERFSDLRVEEALDCGAQVIATACPYCISCLEDSVKANRHTDLVVMDIAEIAALSI
jgi:Fe-S oxidoreductase